MRNVTVTLDDHTARWARVESARRDISVSRFIRDLLEQEMHADESYEAAMRAFLKEVPQVLKSGKGYPSRDELHDRASLRR